MLWTVQTLLDIHANFCMFKMYYFPKAKQNRICNFAAQTVVYSPVLMPLSKLWICFKKKLNVTNLQQNACDIKWCHLNTILFPSELIKTSALQLLVEIWGNWSLWFSQELSSFACNIHQTVNVLRMKVLYFPENKSHLVKIALLREAASVYHGN